LNVQNPRWWTAAILKTVKSPYLLNRLTDFEEIWHGDADWNPAFWQSSLSTPAQLYSFLAASSPHSGDWYQVMPISSCGLRLDDEAVRIGVGLRLGLTFCVPHKCHCGALVDAQGLHGFVCKKTPGSQAARPE